MKLSRALAQAGAAVIILSGSAVTATALGASSDPVALAAAARALAAAPATLCARPVEEALERISGIVTLVVGTGGGTVVNFLRTEP